MFKQNDKILGTSEKPLKIKKGWCVKFNCVRKYCDKTISEIALFYTKKDAQYFIKNHQAEKYSQMS